MTLAMRPVLMFLPAVLNHSELCREKMYRFSSHTCWGYTDTISFDQT
jgi:hypothetical protein